MAQQSDLLSRKSPATSQGRASWALGVKKGFPKLRISKDALFHESYRCRESYPALFSAWSENC